jgi:hypothetical protein
MSKNKLSIIEELMLLCEADENHNDNIQQNDVAQSQDNQMSNPNTPLLKVDVNPNPTKKGVKVQFVLPKGYTITQKEELTQKLKTKLNAGLTPHMMSVDVDLDVPYENVIGFLIRLSNIKLLIKSILEGGTQNPNQNNTPPEI